MKNLSLNHLSKTYFDPYSGREVAAVRDVSFRVEPGEFVAVVGPSGCGKTTILNMIAGFLPHTGGDILLDGKPVQGPGPERGVVFQSFALFPWKTVLDNVGFGPKMRGLPKAECDRIARAVNTSTAENGSSMHSSSGSRARARATPTSCFIPRESSRGNARW